MIFLATNWLRQFQSEMKSQQKKWIKWSSILVVLTSIFRPFRFLWWITHIQAEVGTESASSFSSVLIVVTTTLLYACMMSILFWFTYMKHKCDKKIWRKEVAEERYTLINENQIWHYISQYTWVRICMRWPYNQLTAYSLIPWTSRCLKQDWSHICSSIGSLKSCNNSENVFHFRRLTIRLLHEFYSFCYFYVEQFDCTEFG